MRQKRPVPPAFQFYADDWAHSVASLTLEERGAHITLMAWSWKHGQVPQNMTRIASILGTDLRTAKRVLGEVLKRWTRHPKTGNWFNRRLERTRKALNQFRKQQSNKGKASAKARAKRVNRGSTAVATAVATGAQPKGQPNTQPKPNSPISDLRSPKDQDPDQEQRADARATHAVLVRLAHTVYDDIANGTLSAGEDKEELKLRAAKARIDYDADSIRKALDSAAVQRARRSA